VVRRFRGMTITINVVNADGLATGICCASIDGVDVMDKDDAKRGALVPVEALTDGAVLTVTMGQAA